MLPAVIWAGAWALHQAGVALTIGGPIGGLLLTYGASLASVAWRNRKLVPPRRHRGERVQGREDQGRAARVAVQLLLVVAALLVLAVGWLLGALGGMAVVGLQELTTAPVITLLRPARRRDLPGHVQRRDDAEPAPVLPGPAGHGVRRPAGPACPDGQTVARPYEPAERTSLSAYGLLPPGTTFPHVVFAASATPGREAHGARGPPISDLLRALGGRPRRRLRERGVAGGSWLRPGCRRDLTVQGAVALSGAAIAASIGGQRTAWYETLFVVTGLAAGRVDADPAVPGPPRTPRPGRGPSRGCRGTGG